MRLKLSMRTRSLVGRLLLIVVMLVYANISSGETVIGNIGSFMGEINDIIFVVYTERVQIDGDEEKTGVTRLISARFATNFERGLYYGKQN